MSVLWVAQRDCEGKSILLDANIPIAAGTHVLDVRSLLPNGEEDSMYIPLWKLLEGRSCCLVFGTKTYVCIVVESTALREVPFEMMPEISSLEDGSWVVKTTVPGGPGPSEGSSPKEALDRYMEKSEEGLILYRDLLMTELEERGFSFVPDAKTGTFRVYRSLFQIGHGLTPAEAVNTAVLEARLLRECLQDTAESAYDPDRN